MSMLLPLSIYDIGREKKITVTKNLLQFFMEYSGYWPVVFQSDHSSRSMVR